MNYFFSEKRHIRLIFNTLGGGSVSPKVKQASGKEVTDESQPVL